MRKDSKWARAAFGASASLTAVALLAACGTSTKNASANSPTSTAKTAAASGTAAAANPAVASAQSAVAQAEQAPTTLPITTPLNAKPPTGKTFVWLQCDITQCKDEADGLAAATAAVGWKLKTIPYQSANPATLISGMQQALQYKPAAVGLSGLPEATWQSELPAYEAAGVPIEVAYVGPQVLDKNVIANIGGPSYVTAVGKDIADYVIADSNGTGKALLFQVPDFPILKNFDDSFKATMAGCSGCSVTPLTGTIAQVTSGQTVPAIISALQRNPSVKYLATDNGPWVDGLPAALSAAGLKVKILGESGDVQNLSDVKAGTETAFTGLALHYGAWAMLDAALRHVEGMPVGDNGNSDLPLQLLTTGGSFTVADSFDVPANYAAQMEKLWLVG